MAVEVSVGTYLFEPIEENVFMVDIEPDSDSVHPFRHNPIHDLESIWWLAMWSIFNYYPDNIGADPEALENQRHSYEALFSPGFALDKERISALTSRRPSFLSSIVSPFHAVGQLAFRLRNMLRVSYNKAETTLPIKSDCQVFHSAFATTALLLKAMKTSLEEAGITDVTRVYELLYPRKRKAEETEEIQEDAPPMKK